MDNKTLYRVLGILAFVISLVVYMMTVQPVVPFWDCGEFSAASIWQQVPHPPGAPLFLMIGKLFHVIIPFGDPGWRVNMAAVVSSAFTVWLLYLITVKVIINLRKEDIKTSGDSIAVYGSALVAALAYTFSDTFWFNAVESEVYATSTLFVAVIVYLMMRWNEKADEPGNERYLLLIAYLIGLSMGVHLLAILTIFSLSMLVYFRKYEFKWSSFIFMGVIALAMFYFVYKFMLTHMPQLIASSVVWLVVILILVGLAFYWIQIGKERQMPILAIFSLTFILMLFGFTTYTQILLRSNANPPMNENEPHNFDKLVSYLGREQYGTQTNWPRRTDWHDDMKVQEYLRKYANGDYVYGPWDFKDGEYASEWENTVGEIKYLWKYQIDHMYIRYFLWNFVGRSSDVQDAPAAWFGSETSEILNYKSGYADQFPVKFFALPLLLGLLGLFFHFWKDPKMALIYFILFLLTGVLMAIAQNQQKPQPRERDYFYAASFMIWAMWIGMGAYMIIDWIKDYMANKKITPAIAGGVVMLSLIIAPINMAMGGWKIHSRAGNYLAFDYSYNILQSVEQDAILFTAGDNDTFPVWYLQDVMGVRRDVRIANLSLGNTSWYVKQLKDREPWGAKKVPLSFTDESLSIKEGEKGALGPEGGQPYNVTIPVSKEILAQYTDDRNIINSGKMTFTFKGDPSGRYFRVQDKLVKDIIMTTRFERPVYFSTTAGGSDYAGLDEYLRQEGMALRICPVKQPPNSCDVEIMDKCFLDNVDNTNEFHKEQHYGFKFRNLNNLDVYYDKVQTNYMTHYRRLYLQYAKHALDVQKDKKKAARILNAMNKNISTKQFPLQFYEEFQLIEFYLDAGDDEMVKKYTDECIKSCQDIIANPDNMPDRISQLYDFDFRAFDLSAADKYSKYYGPYSILLKLYDNMDNIDKEFEVMNQFYDEWYKKYNDNKEYYYSIFNKYQGSRNSMSDYELRDYYLIINILKIQDYYTELELKKLANASNEEKIKKLDEMKEKFIQGFGGDQLLTQVFTGQVDLLINMKKKQFEPKPDTVTASNAITIE